MVQEALNAGVWVFGGGMENQRASIVATDGTVTEEALKWLHDLIRRRGILGTGATAA